ncbi:hypothetical protein ACOSQ2_026091 [Xanthoceras sorbifolium]
MVFGSPPQPPRQPYSNSWLPHPAGSLKLNFDAAVKPGSSVMGSGVGVRDSEGKIIVASTKPLLGFFSAELGELLALLEGLLLAKELNLVIEWVELDAVNNVKALFRDVGVFNGHDIPRSRNRMAHSLASLAFSFKEEFCWFNPKPNFLVGLL